MEQRCKVELFLKGEEINSEVQDAEIKMEQDGDAEIQQGSSKNGMNNNNNDNKKPK